MSDVEEKLADIIVTQFAVDRDAITLATRFEEDLDVNSLDAVEVIIAVEKYFGIRIPGDEAEGLLTVGDLIDYIKSKRT